MNTRNDVLRPRWSKVLADLWENKTRTLLVVASIAVGVFAIGAIANAYLILSEDLDASYAAVKPANIEIMSDVFDDDLIKSIETHPRCGGCRRPPFYERNRHTRGRTLAEPRAGCLRRLPGIQD